MIVVTVVGSGLKKFRAGVSENTCDKGGLEEFLVAVSENTCVKDGFEWKEFRVEVSENTPGKVVVCRLRNSGFSLGIS